MFEFSKTVLDNFYHPRNVGTFDVKQSNVGTGIVGTKSSASRMRLQVLIDNGIIKDTRFKAYGCPSCIAAASLIAEWLQGRTMKSALEITCQMIIEELQLPKEKYYCAMMAQDVIKEAISTT